MPGSTITLTFQTQTLLNIIMIVGAIVLVCAVAVFLFEAMRHLVHLLFWPRGGDLTRDQIKKRWTQVEAYDASSEAISYRMAVIEADKLLDEVLRSMGMPGASLGERLTFAQKKYFRLRQVWWAHKVRNQLVHEDGFDLKRSQAHAAVKGFRDALRELGAM